MRPSQIILVVCWGLLQPDDAVMSVVGSKTKQRMSPRVREVIGGGVGRVFLQPRNSSVAVPRGRTLNLQTTLRGCEQRYSKSVAEEDDTAACS